MDDSPPASADARATAVDLRDSLDADERERVEATVAELVDLLGKTHATAACVSSRSPRNRCAFRTRTALEAAPNTLSRRLREFTEAGLLERRADDEVPPRVEYEPTGKAREPFPVFGHRHRWAIERRLDAGRA